MRMTHILMLGLALLCAATAALLSRAWLIRQSSHPSVEAAAPVPMQSIVVAARDLKYGDKLDAKAVKLVSWSSDTLPKGAFLSAEALLAGSESRAVLSTIGENEPILQHKLLGGTASNALAAKLSENMKAVTIRVNEIAGVAGFIQPEDRVDVIHIYGTKTGPETPRQGASAAKVLLQNLRVLAVDQLTQRKDQPTPAKAVTLEVTTKEAQTLALAGQAGELSLMLNRIASQDSDEVTRTVTYENLILGDQDSESEAAPGGPVITVTRSTERKDYRVKSDPGRDEFMNHEILSHQGGRASSDR